MITEERKKELISEMVYYIERYLDKQAVISDLASTVAGDRDEYDWLKNLNYYVKIES